MKVFINIALFSLLITTIACKQEYPLPKETNDLDLLVVEGLLNTSGPTVVRLSRTFNPTDIGTILPVVNAEVTVEGEDNTMFFLPGNTSGEYTSNQLPLDNAVKYRLRIKTTGGQEYLSDFVPVQPSPAIDSVHWKRTDDAIQLLVTTHDPQNKTWYYRWEYDETWEIHSDFLSHFKWMDPAVILRSDPYSIYYCWKSDASTRIFLNSSAKLTQDVISAQQLHSIPIAAEQISVRYSMLVRQYALTREAYQFWEIMKKNTEQVGTLFDPQPSQLLSNIRAVNDETEAVIGYVSAGSVSEKRLFINRREVEPWRYRRDCTERVIPLDSIQYYFPNEVYIPLQEWYFFGRLAGYTSSLRTCVDCTTRGTNVRPAFW
jgi:hypothetical protein